MIYLDNSATTKPYKEVLQTYQTVADKYFANPSSVHGLGGTSEQLLLQSRNRCADLLQVKPSEVVFTSGGTEGNNIAIKGIALEHQSRGKHLITTEIEHPSVYESFQQLESLGFDVTYLPVNEKGLVSIQELESAIRNDTILVSIMHVNNELGTVQPIFEIAKLLKYYPKVFFHVDHVQGLSKVPLKLHNVDLCTISGHKIHGVKGSGILYVREGVRLSSLFTGGEQELKVRAGTENLPAVAAITKALRLSFQQAESCLSTIGQLKLQLMESLNKMDGIIVNTPTEDSAPHIVNFSAVGIKPEVLIHSLEKFDIYVSTKSACSSKLVDASKVLLAAGLGTERATSAIRVSMSFDTTKEDIIEFLNALNSVLPKLQKVMR
ncbi:cysteine desulfurase family protein [Bacillus solimangrovi]|uniref:Cysteine desulfurase NifS n=1 Tax=Bacillus solimangrovi TaxID=1305675 RepID=A0A1E5LCK6_9BACI|nr:cysteine desulfurase family protein [Bacillus solimangrovi]OEH91811.1 cysteine desulfurase NifS [Bacillus solimangrovi]